MSIFPEWIGPVGTGGGTVIVTKVTVVGGEILIDFADEEDFIIELADDSIEVSIDDKPLTIEM